MSLWHAQARSSAPRAPSAPSVVEAPRLPRALGIWRGVNALDMLLTFYLLGIGGNEGNPLLALALASGVVSPRLVLQDGRARGAGRVSGAGGGRLPLASDVKVLFDAWCIVQAPGVAVGDRLLARRVDAGTAQRSQPVDYLPWITLKPENFSADDLTTNEIETMNLASAGSLKPKAGATTKFTPLITSSPEALLIDTDKLKSRPDFVGRIR